MPSQYENLLNSLTQKEVDNWWKNQSESNVPADHKEWKYRFKKFDKSFPIKYVITSLAQLKDISIRSDSISSNNAVRYRFAKKFGVEITEKLVFDSTEQLEFLRVYDQIDSKDLFYQWLKHVNLGLKNIPPYYSRFAIKPDRKTISVEVGSCFIWELYYGKEDAGKLGFMVNKDFAEAKADRLRQEYVYKGQENLVKVTLKVQDWADLPSDMMDNHEFASQEYINKNALSGRLNKRRGSSTSNSFLKMLAYKNISVDDALKKKPIQSQATKEAEKSISNKSTETLKPKNIILYGPPGTGKTFKLKSEFFDQYTTRETSITQKQHFNNLAEDLSWWQVIALALLEDGDATVPKLKENRWVKFKIQNSNSKSESNAIWQNLQSHSKEDSKTVNLGYRRSPLIFDKLKDSVWTVDKDAVDEQAQDLLDVLDSDKNFSPDPDKEIKRFIFTTFHQSYTYEDFIEGIKPAMDSDTGVQELSYVIESGIFKKLCERAEKDPENRYAIFIDEINRGNIAQIFGELITLIEPDKRADMSNALSTRLPYSKTEFSVPKNLDLIGTMNTADRSVEALDTALRRRFSFVEMPPKYDLKELKQEVAGVQLSALLQTINERIEKLLDKDHLIGHAYFINVQTTEDLVGAFNDKITPLLQEYFYNDFAKIGMVLGKGFVQKKTVNQNFANFEDGLNGDYENREVFEIKRIEVGDLKEAIADLMNEKKKTVEEA